MSAHFPLADPEYSFTTRAAAAVSFGLCALVWSRYLRQKPQRMPWPEVFLALQYVNFGLAITGMPRPLGIDQLVPESDSYDRAAWIAAGSSAVLVGAWEVMEHLFRTIKFDWLQAPISAHSLSRAAPAYGIMTAIYVVTSTVVPSVRPAVLGGLAAVFDLSLNTYLFAAVATAAFLTNPTLRNRMLVFASAALGIFVTVWSSMSGVSVFTFLSIAVVWVRIRGRLPWLPIAVGISIFVVLQPVKQHYRELRWNEQGTDVSVMEAWGDAFDVGAGEGLDLEAGRQRTDELGSLAYTVQMVPAVVPYTGGRAYEMVAYSVVPRLFWPNKPDMTKFGLDPFLIELGLQTEASAETSTTGIPIVGHGYLEHGIAGALGWMALVAVALAAFSSLFKEGLAGITCGSSLVMSWLPGSASGFVGFFGSIFQVVIATVLTGWMLHLLGRARSRTESPAMALAPADVRASQRPLAVVGRGTGFGQPQRKV